MTSKKYLILVGLISLFMSNSVLAQDAGSGMYKGGGYDFTDTSLIPNKRLPQQRDFLNGQYDFPAKPRNQWEIGINGGLLNVSGDVRSKSIFNGPKKMLETLGWGINVRKAWGYVMSTRLQFNHGTASGFNYDQSQGYKEHWTNHWKSAGFTGQPVNYNYKTTISELSFQLLASLNNLKFHRARNKTSYYVFVGLGGLAYKTMSDVLRENNTLHDFSSITSLIATNYTQHIYEKRKTINTAVKTEMDGNYETASERHGNRGWFGAGDGYTTRGIGVFGGGIQLRLTNMISLHIEDKVSVTMDDLVDGQRWQEDYGNFASVMTRDYDNINYLSLGLNFNLGGNSVSPMWWENPLDYGYNELKSKRPSGGKCDNDADGDGISDCFDRCPNTPGGASVDSHGCPFDTDGDGVADYKDKQLITPSECQPSDADGVGKCPDPPCCKGVVPQAGCNSVSSGSINFGAGSAKLSSAGMSQLNGLANSLRANPNCKAVISGSGNGSKIEQQRSWDRVNSVINYMVDKQGIDRDRFIFQYGGGGDANSVEYRSAAAGEEGPSNTPPPFPNLRK